MKDGRGRLLSRTDEAEWRAMNADNSSAGDGRTTRSEYESDHPQPARRPYRAHRVPQRGNPWGNPCPICGADRYERCFKITGMDRSKFSMNDLQTGAGADGKFIYIKDTPCAKRLTWYPTDQEGDDE